MALLQSLLKVRPKEWRRLAVWACLCVLVSSHAQTPTQNNGRGQTIPWQQPARRVVSLLPSLTETVCVLGACDRLVGVDRYSNWPERVAALPKVGGGLDPNIEAIVKLKPDVVLLATSSKTAARLQSLGIRVVALEPQTLADVEQALRQVGLILGSDNAPVVWAGIQARMKTIIDQMPAQLAHTRVYFEVDHGPYAAGVDSFIGQMLSQLGAQNIIPQALGPFPKINPEFVVHAQPDVIMLAPQGGMDVAQRPGWAQMTAMKHQRICVFSAAEMDVLVRPGPRLAEAAALMAACLKRHSPVATERR